MVEIIVKSPRRKNRAYVFSDDTDADRFIEALEKKAVRIKENPLKLSQRELEDLSDVIASNEAIREIERTGVTSSWEDIKAKHGL